MGSFVNAISKKLLISSFLALALFAGSAQAEVKIATVDVNRILNESKDAQSKRKELDDLSLKAKKAIDDRKNVLQATEKKLKEAKVTDDSKEAEKFRADAREFERLVKDSQEDLKKEFLKVNKSLTQKTMKAVEEYAKANNIDLVLDKSEKNRGPILFGNAGADITDAVIKRLND